MAERHGLHVRTMRRHAADEDWPALRARHATAGVLRWRETARAGALDDPAAGAVEVMRAERLADLLVHVSGDAPVCEADRLAAGAAAPRRPQETLLWLPTAREADRMAGRIDRWPVATPVHLFRAR